MRLIAHALLLVQARMVVAARVALRAMALLPVETPVASRDFSVVQIRNVWL